MCDATRELLHLEEGKITIDDIAAMCVDTTCCSVVFMDDDGTSLYPCIMWCHASGRQGNEGCVGAGEEEE